MASRLDHITVVASCLQDGADYVRQALGVVPGPGRQHPDMGTHNLLLSLGPQVYLEVICVDPTAAPVGRPRWFGLDDVPAGRGGRLGAWVASTDNIEHADDAVLGDIQVMRREAHTWQIRVKGDGSAPLDGAAPLLIQRASGGSPAASLTAQGLLFDRLEVTHPEPRHVVAVLASIGLASFPKVVLSQGTDCLLAAVIHTPVGIRRIGGPA